MPVFVSERSLHSRAFALQRRCALLSIGPSTESFVAVSPAMSDDHFTGTSTGAPFFLINIARSFAGFVLLAFRPTT
jgi:hypothetical protein